MDSTASISCFVDYIQDNMLVIFSFTAVTPPYSSPSSAKGTKMLDVFTLTPINHLK